MCQNVKVKKNLIFIKSQHFVYGKCLYNVHVAIENI